MVTVQDAVIGARPRLPDPDSASLDAQLLLGYVLGVGRATILAHGERVLTADEALHYEQLIARRAQGEPYAYLVGKQAFYDLELAVSSAVLIPRSETELLVEEALVWTRQHPSLSACDVGTGSGAIAISVAKHAPQATVYAIDRSPEALAIAQHNANTYTVPNLTFFEGDLAQPLITRGLQVDLLMANLPYIPTQDMLSLAVSHYEPHLALDGGDDGLDLVRQLLTQVPHVCRAGAWILLEIGAGQGQTVLDIATALHPHSAEILYDYAGHDRIVKIVL